VVKQVTFAVPGDLATPTGGYVYDRRIVAELPKFGWQVDVINIGDSFPRPSPGERATAHLQLAAIASARLVVIDGLAFGVLSQTVRELAATRRLIALVHHPLAMETGLPEDEATKFRASERLALMSARRVITTSMTTAGLLKQMFAVPGDLLSVVLPGTDRSAFHERPIRKPVNLLAVGSIIPRKGYDLLVEALGGIADLPWRLVIVGDASRNPAAAQQLERHIAKLGLTDRIELVGAVSSDRLQGFYRSADVFVLPSRYEGFGMAFTEAIAHGLPVIGTTAGAIPEAVPSGAGLLVPADDAGALAVALMRLIGDPVERTRLAAGAWSAATALPTWVEAGRQFAQALDAVT
jgi:glycosyltransferase involved in cell wall biosynthesis